MKLFAAQINPTIGDLQGNVEKILQALQRGAKGGSDLIVFPELAITGYPPEDLLLDFGFIAAAEKQLEKIRPFTKGLAAIVGLPRFNPRKKEKFLFNSAAIFQNGELIGFKDKTLLPTYDVFDERRYFEPGEESFVFEHLGWKIGVTICEDIWTDPATSPYTHYEKHPVLSLKEQRPDLLINLSASPYFFKRKETRAAVCSLAAKMLDCPILLCNQVGANDQIVFDGHSLYMNQKGELIQSARGFIEEDFIVEADAHVCPCNRTEQAFEDLYHALVLGVKDYFSKQGFKKALLGLSGGVDSALVACIAKDALGAQNVEAFALPSRFSSSQSFEDAKTLANNLGISFKEISIEPVFESYLDLIQSQIASEPTALVRENLQARIRGMVLMAASNQTNALLLNTSNKSELAMGYSTLYGDACGALGVLSDVIKLRVYELCHFVNRKEEIISQAILKRAPSAELRPNQTDQDTLPPYEILDPIIEDYIEKRLTPEEIAQARNCSPSFIEEIVHRIHLAEYKRRQLSIGIRVTPKAFSKGRNVPIVQKWR